MGNVFARFVAIFMMGALSVLCVGLTKMIGRVVTRSADGIVSSRISRDLAKPALDVDQRFELRLNPASDDDAVESVVERAVIRAGERMARSRACEKNGQSEFQSDRCDRSGRPVEYLEFSGQHVSGSGHQHLNSSISPGSLMGR